MVRQIARPMPIPRSFVLANGWNRRSTDLRREPWSVVGDRDLDACSPSAPSRRARCGRPAVADRLGRVADEVEQHLLELRAIDQREHAVVAVADHDWREVESRRPRRRPRRSRG